LRSHEDKEELWKVLQTGTIMNCLMAVSLDEKTFMVMGVHEVNSFKSQGQASVSIVERIVKIKMN